MARRVAEWRRRLGGGGVSQTFDGQVVAGADDGWWRPGSGTFNATGTLMYAGVGSTTAVHIWMRWDNVTVPNGATIDAAYIEPYTSFGVPDDGLNVKTNIYFNDEDDAVAPTTAADAEGKALTAASTAWDDQNFPTGFTQSPSMVGAIQEVVDRGGWASGQAMMTLWRDDGSLVGDYYICFTWNRAPQGDFGGKLHIEYTA